MNKASEQMAQTGVTCFCGTTPFKPHLCCLMLLLLVVVCCLLLLTDRGGMDSGLISRWVRAICWHHVEMDCCPILAPLSRGSEGQWRRKYTQWVDFLSLKLIQHLPQRGAQTCGSPHTAPFFRETSQLPGVRSITWISSVLKRAVILPQLNGFLLQTHLLCPHCPHWHHCLRAYRMPDRTIERAVEGSAKVPERGLAAVYYMVGCSICLDTLIDIEYYIPYSQNTQIQESESGCLEKIL